VADKPKPEDRPITVRDFAERKRKGEKLVVMTAYDALFGRLVDESGVDAILVGDSVGTAVMGYTSTLPVTLDHMIYHASAVRRGVKRALIIIDMPFLSYQASIESAVLNCGRAIQETGVTAVKVEGGSSEMLDTVHALVRTGIPVMAHIGFTPQSVNTIGGARVQGREEEGAERLIGEAKGLEEAGAFGIVLELVPAPVSARITAAVQTRGAEPISFSRHERQALLRAIDEAFKRPLQETLTLERLRRTLLDADAAERAEERLFGRHESPARPSADHV